MKRGKQAIPCVGAGLHYAGSGLHPQPPLIFGFNQAAVRYMVINILKPATASTIASSRLIAGPPRRLLPYAEPIYPPTTAAAAHKSKAAANTGLTDTTPSSP